MLLEIRYSLFISNPDAHLPYITLCMANLSSWLMLKYENEKLRGMVVELKTELLQWNRKDVNTLSLIYQEHQFEGEFINQIFDLIEEEEFASGATWFLKHHFEQGEQLNDSEINTLYGKLNAVKNWEARLHLLQVIPYMPISDQNKSKVDPFIHQCLDDDNKFIRTWAYNAMFVLSQQYPEYISEVNHLFKMALVKESPSVKARINHIMAQNKR